MEPLKVPRGFTTLTKALGEPTMLRGEPSLVTTRQDDPIPRAGALQVPKVAAQAGHSVDSAAKHEATEEEDFERAPCLEDQ